MHEPLGQAGADTMLDPLGASVIVSTRNRPEMLMGTIDSILRGNSLPGELIIIDQSAEPNPRAQSLIGSRGCEIRYLWTTSKGVSRSRNEGARAARQNIFVFTDDDVLMAPEWLADIVRGLEEAPSPSVVTGRVSIHQESPGGFQLSAKSDTEPAVYRGRIQGDVLFAANMAMYRSTIEDLGYFDERLGPGSRFPGAEDNDFGFRLLEAGYSIMYLPEAVMYHRAWRTRRHYLPLCWSYGLGQGAFYAKHMHIRDRFMLMRMARDVGGKLIAAAGNLRHDRMWAAGDTTHAIGMVCGACVWLLTQHETT